MRKLQAAGLLSALTATLVLAACGGGTDENPSLDTQTANAVGVTLAAQVAGAPTSFTATGVSSGSVGGGFFGVRAQGLARWAAPSLAPNLVSRTCSPSVDDPTDTDGDGVPDDATFTFSQANCTTGNFYITGLINISDVTAAVGYDATFTNFLAYISSQNGDFFSIKVNGTHGVAGTPTTGILSENLVTAVNGKSGTQTLSGSLSNNWTLQFDAAQGQNIVMDDVLPDGDFTIQGNFTYNINGQRFAFSVRTESALVFDSTCVLANPFSSGELRAHLGGPNGTVFVKVTYNGCGVDPTVVLIGQSA